MWTWIEDSRSAEVLHNRYASERQDHQREDECDEHRHLHVVRLDFFPEILRSASDHQASDENSKHHVDQNAVHAGAYAAEDDLAEHDVDQRDHAAERRKRIVPSVDRAATGVGCGRSPQGGVRDTEANFFAFHVAARLRRACALIHTGKQRVTLRLSPVRDSDAGYEKNGHCGPDGPAMSLRAGYAPER